jgi:hypothetical protein
MPIVKVTANHHGGDKMHVVGETREVPENVAAQLKRDGLVEYAGEAAPKEKGENINVSGKEKVEKVAVKEKVNVKK